MHRGANGARTQLFYHYRNQIAVPLVVASPEERISTSYLVDAPAIMGFRIERDTVKFAHYKGAATIPTAFLGSVAAPQRCFLTRAAGDHRRSLPRFAASCADGMHRGANGACAIILPLPK
ncbi:hypothetical protein MRX96_033944 [Rhipicephalus microplus]